MRSSYVISGVVSIICWLIALPAFFNIDFGFWFLSNAPQGPTPYSFIIFAWLAIGFILTIVGLNLKEKEKKE